MVGKADEGDASVCKEIGSGGGRWGATKVNEKW